MFILPSESVVVEWHGQFSNGAFCVMHIRAARCPPDHSFQKMRNMATRMSEQDQAEIRLEYARLKQEHSDLDAAINAMVATGCDALQIQRLKKKKLQLKDRLQATEDRIIPDIIA